MVDKVETDDIKDFSSRQNTVQIYRGVCSVSFCDEYCVVEGEGKHQIAVLWYDDHSTEELRDHINQAILTEHGKL